MEKTSPMLLARNKTKAFSRINHSLETFNSSWLCHHDYQSYSIFHAIFSFHEHVVTILMYLLSFCLFYFLSISFERYESNWSAWNLCKWGMVSGAVITSVTNVLRSACLFFRNDMFKPFSVPSGGIVTWVF